MQTPRPPSFTSEELKNLLDALPTPAFFKDTDFRYRWINRVGCDFLGRTEAEIIGKTDADLFPPETAARIRTVDRQVLAAGEGVTVSDDKVPDSQGALHYFTVNKTPIRNPAGEVIGLLGVTVDVTERHMAEAERFTHLRRQRDALVQEIHHRIKNHLQGVSGLLHRSITAHPGLAEPLRGVLGQIESIAGVHGLQSRLGTQRLNPVRVIEMVAQLAQGPIAIDAGHVSICLTEEDAVPFALTINELISNAFKHVLAGQAGEVRVEARQDEAGLHVRVANRPARLPPGFDFAAGSGLGTGLRLVSTLLPSEGARLAFGQDGDRVLADLHLDRGKLLDQENCPD